LPFVILRASCIITQVPEVKQSFRGLAWVFNSV
jgi:hypothetical protein